MKYWMGDGYTAEGVDYSWTQVSAIRLAKIKS
jgi:hypothetical protein